MTAEQLPELTRAIVEQAFGDDQRVITHDRTLVIVSFDGLSNRIRALTSGLAVAEVAGREFAMLWPSNEACGARFDELFQNRWRIMDSSIRPVDMRPLRMSTWSTKKLQQFLVDQRQHIVLSHWDWLVDVRTSGSRSQLQQRCVQWMNELEPVAPLAAQIESFRAEHFAPTMIGVHLRRGDAIRFRPQSSSNTNAAFRAVDRFLKHDPQAGILLCTDDGAPDPFINQPTPTEDIQGKFIARYGSRVVWTTPRTLDRRSPAAIQDAVVDLWLLRATDYLVGTYRSSFSEIATTGRTAPYIMCASQSAAEDRWERVAQSIGLDRVVCAMARRHLGMDTPFAIAWQWFVRLPLAPVRKQRRRLGKVQTHSG
jgi:hypothetical protein